MVLRSVCCDRKRESADDIWNRIWTDTKFCQQFSQTDSNLLSHILILFVAFATILFAAWSNTLLAYFVWGCYDTLHPTGTTFKCLGLNAGVFLVQMVTMRSQVQHLPPLHHVQCPLQPSSLCFPVQQPLIYCCRGFRSSAQIGTLIHTWLMDQYQTFGSHTTVCACIKKICENSVTPYTSVYHVYLCSAGSEIIPLLDEYLHGNVCKDLENVKGGASGLQHFQCILSHACESLHRFLCPFSAAIIWNKNIAYVLKKKWSTICLPQWDWPDSIQFGNLSESVWSSWWPPLLLHNAGTALWMWFLHNHKAAIMNFFNKL